MSRIAYVNGRYQQWADATVHIEDRGFQFADGVYEVCEVRRGVLVDEARHLARLMRSLGKLSITPPMTLRALGVVMREVVRRNRVHDGLLYLQVTRGVAPRGHAFPVKARRPTLVVTVRPIDESARQRAENGIAVITVPETRWAGVDIKTVSLLPNVLAKQAAVEAGAQEAWFVGADGLVNEGASSNAWIVSEQGTLLTAPTTAQILEGITRAVLLELIDEMGLTIEERRFSVAEAVAAKEAFVTSATALVTPVVRIDGTEIGDGRPGELTMALRHVFLDAADSQIVA